MGYFISGHMKVVTDDGDEMERPLEVLLEGGPGPEDLLLVLRDSKRRHELLRKA